MDKKMSINTEMKNESIRTGAVCIDDKVIWTSDEAIGGLYTIDKMTFEVKGILDPSQVFKYGKFKIQSIIQWKDFIIILPAELNKKWVIYDKKSGEVDYKDVVGISGKTTGIYLVGNLGFLIPATMDIPIIIVDLETMVITRRIKNWSEDIGKDSEGVFETRTGVVADTDVLFSLYGTKYLIRLNQNTTSMFQLQIPYGICSISYSDKELWVLPINGDGIYRVNGKGRIIEEVALNVNNKSLNASDFVRIISVSGYIFLLPASRNEICVYDKQNKKAFMIGEEESLINEIPLQCEASSYWEYCIEENILYFMPVKGKFLEFDLDTLMWKQRNIYLPSLIAEHGILYWFGWNQWQAQGNISTEWGVDSINLYCDMLKESNAVCNSENKQQGEHIWRKMKL